MAVDGGKGSDLKLGSECRLAQILLGSEDDDDQEAWGTIHKNLSTWYKMGYRQWKELNLMHEKIAQEKLTADEVLLICIHNCFERWMYTPILSSDIIKANIIVVSSLKK